MTSESNERRSPLRRLPKKATPAYLERAALFYLERYAASAENLRRVLLRKVRRSSEAHGNDPAEGTEAVEALIARFLRAGLLDDGLYARGQALSLARRGNSERAIRLKLQQRGIDEADITQALAARHEVNEDPELAAALAYAKRRRIGPYRTDPTDRAATRAKDLAALARRGFAPALCRRVIDTDDLEALWEETRSGA